MLPNTFSRIILALVLGRCVVLQTVAIANAAEQERTQGPVVVELFTSQGCSSCPPADRLLREISTWSEQHRAPVFCLSFHVDYWNSLGWTDPYSSRQFSERQRAYANASRSARVYTPQMIVNGRAAFVGSRSADAQQAIKKALEAKPKCTIELTVKRSRNGERRRVEYAVAGGEENSVLNIAIIQREAKNKVPRGENAGRNLAHVNVVRAFQTVALERPTGQIEIQFPGGLDVDNARIIAYIQNRRSMQISGTTAKDF